MASIHNAGISSLGTGYEFDALVITLLGVQVSWADLVRSSARSSAPYPWDRFFKPEYAGFVSGYSDDRQGCDHAFRDSVPALCVGSKGRLIP